MDPAIREKLNCGTSADDFNLVHPWDSDETLLELHRRQYYQNALSRALEDIIGNNARSALSSFGAALFYLQRSLICEPILSSSEVHLYGLLESTSSGKASAHVNPTSLPRTSKAPVPSAVKEVTYLFLDGNALHNLEILYNTIDLKESGSLLSKIDNYKIPSWSTAASRLATSSTFSKRRH